VEAWTQSAARINGVELAYREAGAPDDPLVVCLHGFPDTPRTFERLALALVDAGFRVVAPWLRGYPPSEVVPGPYQTAALAHDAIALAAELSPRPAFLVGHDWGGLATYGAAVLAPSAFVRAVVLSVAPSRAFREFLVCDGPQQQAAWYQFLFQIEGIAEAAVSADDYAMIDRLWRTWSPGWIPDPELVDAAKRSIHEGFPAALRFYRDAWQRSRQDARLADDQSRIFRGPVTIPTLLLHGLTDGCVQPGAYAGAAAYFAGEHEIFGVPGVGHFLHLEAPGVVNPRIVEFLDAGRQGAPSRR
jgi:pimeloyl-ACP methyl ester carboxylesterase